MVCFFLDLLLPDLPSESALPCQPPASYRFLLPDTLGFCRSLLTHLSTTCTALAPDETLCSFFGLTVFVASLVEGLCQVISAWLSDASSIWLQSVFLAPSSPCRLPLRIREPGLFIQGPWVPYMPELPGYSLQGRSFPCLPALPNMPLIPGLSAPGVYPGASSHHSIFPSGPSCLVGVSFCFLLLVLCQSWPLISSIRL